MSDRGYRYKAFISYSHQDKKWGDWLHKALETYRVPRAMVGRKTESGTVPKRLFPIFRDREELPTSAELGEMINRALKESSHLVVICSPRSAKSRWVNEEIKQFKRMGGGDRVLCLIVDGEPNAADKPELGQEECFPEAAKYQVGEDGELSTERTEPIAADAREGRDGKANALLKLVAGLLGVGFDDLKQRDVARRQKRMAVLSGVSLALAGVMAGLTVWALNQQREAESQRMVAIKARDAEAKQRQRAETELQKATVVSEFVQGIFTAVKPGELKGVDDKDKDLMKLVLGKGSEKISELESQPEVEATIRNILGSTYHSLGLYDEAQAHFEKALAIRLKTLGPEHPSVGLSYNNLGLIYSKKGEYDRAIGYYEKDLAIELKAFGPEHPSVGTNYNNLGSAYNNLGSAYSKKGEYDRAIGYYEKALPIVLKSLGPEHPHVGTIYNNLGLTYSKKGEYDRAIGYYEKALAIQLNSLGPEHPSVGLSYNNLGLIYSKKGEYDRAIGYSEKALPILLKALGPEHFNVGTALDAFDGYCKPASFDITGALKSGENQITILAERHVLNELGSGGLMGPIVLYREK